MRNKIIGCFLVLFFLLLSSVYAQGHQSLNDVLQRMKTEANLTDDEVEAIKPIVKENMKKRQSFFESIAGEASPSKSNIKNAIRAFKKEMNQELSKILSQEKMEKLKEKQNLRESLNKDEIDYSESLSTATALNPQGGSMQF